MRPWAALLACAGLLGCGGSEVNIQGRPDPTLETGRISNRVWSDENRNGLQDSGEPGIPNVLVTLTGPKGRVTQSTNADGLVLFDGLAQGTYLIGMTAPAGYVATLVDAGTDDSLDSDPNPSTVVLRTNDAQHHDVDFGLFATIHGRIGDRVWHDLDRDGIQDPGEPGLNGIRVVLKDASGAVVDEEVTGTDRTGATGHFLFEPLEIGSYTVEVDSTTLPPKFQASPCEVGSDPALDSNCSPAEVRLTSARSTDRTIDFGFYGEPPCTGVIGDLVWLDKDRDGCQDPGEPGIAMVDVFLLQAGRRIRTTTTDALGRYEFLKVCAGTYTVVVDTAGLPPCLVPAPRQACNDPTRDSNGSPATVTLATDDTVDPTIDFGFAPADQGSIHGRVWDDHNRNGLQDPSEPTRTGVRIVLRDTASKVLAMQWTTEAGYAFEGLCAGKYIVEVDVQTLPSGSKPSPCRVGNDPDIDNDCSPVLVEVASNAKVDHIDFGYFTDAPPGSIGDLVWDDQDGDGLQDAGEPGIANIVIVLKSQSGQVLSRQTTNQYGQYLFDRLPPGTYRVEYDPGSVSKCRLPTRCEVGSDRGLDSNCSPSTVVLAAGQHDRTVDFGFQGRCELAIGDFVWVDKDRDGIQDSDEPGLESVKLILRNAHGRQIATTYSDEDGKYEFHDLEPGTYTVEYDPGSVPTGMLPSPIRAGSDRGKDSNPNPATVVLVADDDPTVDFGFQPRQTQTGQQGCSTSHWRNHPGHWPFPTTTLFRAYFVDAFPGKTMWQVIHGSGGGREGLGRETVAALLNAESTRVKYPLTTAKVQSLFNFVATRSSKEQYALKKYFERLNKLGCPDQ